MSEIPDFKEILKGDLLQRGQWVVANITGPIAWPAKVQKVRYRDADIYILPVTKDRYPGVATLMKDDTEFEAGAKLLFRFLSALAWAERGGIVVQCLSGGNLPHLMGRQGHHGVIREEFELFDLPEPSDEKTQLALALFREGLGLNHPAYAFLTFYRILEARFPNGKQRGEWITANLDQIEDRQAKDVLTRLKAEHSDVGKHLYESGRCAVAHASENPTINPDDPADARRLGAELPLMAGLAEHLIEREFGIETTFTAYRKHRYELAGFKEILGTEFVDRLIQGQPFEEGHGVNLPPMRMAIHGKDTYQAFATLTPVQAGLLSESIMVIVAQSLSGLVTVQLRLNFASERLEFDVDTDISVGDNGSAEAAAAIAEAVRFTRDYYLNGRLQIFNSENGELLSRKDAFIPTNVIVHPDRFNEEIERWRSESRTRAEREASSINEEPFIQP